MRKCDGDGEREKKRGEGGEEERRGERMALNDDHTTKDRDDPQELIVNLSFDYGSGESIDSLSSEEQCQRLLNISVMASDGYESTFLRALEMIAITVGDNLSQQKVSDKQMMRHVAEFDTWLLHTVGILKTCKNIPYERLDNVLNLVHCCIFTKWNYAKEKITAALADLYTYDIWREPIQVFLEYGSPEQSDSYMMAFLSDTNRSPSKIVNIFDRANLYINILNMVGEDAERMYKMYWLRDGRICTTYFLHLFERNDRPAALRVASVGLAMFAHSGDLASAILESFGTDEDTTTTAATASSSSKAEEEILLKARCKMYATCLDPIHYEMARASASWNKKWAQDLATMLAANGNHEEEILVLVDAGMNEEAVDALRYDGTLKAAVSHRHDLAASHPDRYYEACRALVKNTPKHMMSKARRDMMLQCLRAMKYIPGRRSDFEEFCRLLLRDSMPDALRNMIKKVGSLP